MKRGVLLRLVEIFKIFGEKNRIRIINILYEKSICVCELQDILKLPQVTVSKHLAKLRDSNIVKTQKKAQRVFYSLTDEISKNTVLKELVLSYRHDEILKNDLINLKKVSKQDNEYICPRS